MKFYIGRKSTSFSSLVYFFVINTTDGLNVVTNKLFKSGLIIKNVKLGNWKKKKCFETIITNNCS